MNGPALLKCICDETRFEILELLQKDDELCVNEFDEEIKKEKPQVSHQLKTLKQKSIKKTRNEGKKTMYSISNPQLSTLISAVTKTSNKIPTLCTDENSS